MTQRGLSNFDVSERWVAKHDVERAPWPSVEVADDVRRDDVGPTGEPGRREVATERLDRLGPALDERRACRAARQRLDAQRASAREEIEDPRPFELRLEDRKERLADAIGCRAGAAAARHHQGPALRFSGDHPHQASAYRRQS